MRCPSWRSCSKSAAASACLRVCSSLLRLRMNPGIRSSRSLATVTLYASSFMSLNYRGRAFFPPLPLSGFVRQRLPCARQMRMHRERRVEREAGLVRGAAAEQDLREVKHGGEMTRLELERAADVAQALVVAPEQVVQHRALVPSFGEVRRAAHEGAQARLGDVVAARGNVARGQIEGLGGGPVWMVHPRVPDAVLRALRLGRPPASGEPIEKRIERQ